MKLNASRLSVFVCNDLRRVHMLNIVGNFRLRGLYNFLGSRNFFNILLCLIEKNHSDERWSKKYYAIVQYLHVIKPDAIFPELSWASGSTATWFDIDVIIIESILLPAMIVPQFHIPFDPESPKVTDRFLLVPRQFSDKSGWLDLNHVVYNNKSGNMNIICLYFV